MQFQNEEEQLRYMRAQNRMKELKSFYKHLGWYLLISFILMVLKFSKRSSIELADFRIVLLWGIVVTIHAAVVFLPQFFLGQNWEERKTRELMNQYSNE